jgi:formylglycine-generating enzyme required for sulfatase activity
MLDFSVLRPGTFAMGSAVGERGHAEWESPVQRTTLSRSFAVCTAEVTRSLFEFFAAVGNGWLPGPDGWQPSAADPVVNITWFEATEMSRWLTGHLGIARPQAVPLADDYSLRLPSEAEWEYACRAGTTTPYSFGSDRSLLANYAWFEDNAGRRTHKAGILRPNPAGLFNMHGQCWEWCLDWFGPYGAEPVCDPLGAAPDARLEGAATGPTEEGGAQQRSKVLRGGSWMQNEGYARSAARRPLPPGNRNSDVTFRLFCTVPEPDASGAARLPWTG